MLLAKDNVLSLIDFLCNFLLSYFYSIHAGSKGKFAIFQAWSILLFSGGKICCELGFICDLSVHLLLLPANKVGQLQSLFIGGCDIVVCCITLCTRPISGKCQGIGYIYSNSLLSFLSTCQAGTDCL
jgi:hypothetical protein